MTAYYNEFDPYAAQWLENLIEEGLIPDGDVDTRSIADVTPIDLIGYEQCHFFAGIGGWPLALRLAGWPDDRPVWTGSCPCQPFSAAGKRRGVNDERHLWPEFNRLIAVGRPAVVFGEQVASKDGRAWLAGIRADLEALGYAVGAADLCAAGVGAPHIRQRLYWVADAGDERRQGVHPLLRAKEAGRDARDFLEAAGSGIAGRLADAGQPFLRGEEEFRMAETVGERPASWLGRSGNAGRLGDASGEGSGRHPGSVLGTQGEGEGQRREPGCVADELVHAGAACGLADVRGAGDSGLEHAASDGREQRRAEPSGRGTASGRGEGFWSDFDLLPCTDGKARRVEPGTFPLAHGVPARVGRLRAYGNAINPWVAKEFILASMP